MRTLVSLVSWWALLVLLWLAFVGTTQKLEVLWGLGAAAIAATAAEAVRSQRLLNFAFERRLFFRGLTAPAAVLFDFGVVTWELARALARGRRITGAYLEAPFPAGEEGRARHAWRRAYATTLGTMGANAIVVEIEPAHNVALLHALRPDLPTGRVAL